jgi:hypothetical protein
MPSNTDAFPPSYLNRNPERMSVEEFAAAILGESNLTESAEFAEAILREYSPDQPRDEKGRWTSDEASDGQRATKTPAENVSKKTSIRWSKSSLEVLRGRRYSIALKEPLRRPELIN